MVGTLVAAIVKERAGSRFGEVQERGGVERVVVLLRGHNPGANGVSSQRGLHEGKDLCGEK